MENSKVSLFITGDTHRNWVSRLSFKNFPESKNFDPNNKKNTFVLICGDFGIWADDKQENYNLLWLRDRPYTTIFIDGNHENFEKLYQYPIEEWHGGKIHRINDSVIHLMRGQVYNIGNQKIFTFGGARSHDVDIEDGILNPTAEDFQQRKKNLIKKGQHFRVLNLNFWHQELPTNEEMQEGINNLAKNHNYVDYIISHCTYTSLQSYITNHSEEFQPDILTEYFEQLSKTIRFKTWYFGHYHKDTPNIQFYGNNIKGVFENIIKVF